MSQRNIFRRRNSQLQLTAKNYTNHRLEYEHESSIILYCCTCNIKYKTIHTINGLSLKKIFNITVL